MVKMTSADSRVSEAIVLWTGYDLERQMWPLRDEFRVVARFGGLAVEIMPWVHSLHDSFFGSGAHDRGVDLAEKTKFATADFRLVHPEVSEEAVRALAWSYAFDHK
jgi:hypothetical protein